MNKEDKLGALWVRESKSARFMSGHVTVDGKKHEVVVFKNGFKQQGDNKPDYEVYKSRKPAPDKAVHTKDDDIGF